MYINLESKQDIINANSKEVLQQYADDIQSALNKVAEGDVTALSNCNISTYGLIDYIGVGNIPNGALVLRNLGYKTYGNIELPDEGYDNCYMHFLHPNIEPPVSYEDTDNHNFCTLWLKLKELE
jgi:hypothetical protein